VTLRVWRMFGRSDDKHGPNGAFPTSNAPLCGAGQSHALWAWSFTGTSSDTQFPDSTSNLRRASVFPRSGRMSPAEHRRTPNLPARRGTRTVHALSSNATSQGEFLDSLSDAFKRV